MSSIPPKPRITNRQEYYTKGEAEKIIPARFKAHSAEPGQAASIMSRNSNTFEKPSHKIPTTIRTGIYSGRPSETSFSQALSLTEVNLLKSKEFAKLADKPQFFCGKTVKLGDFKEKTMGKSNVEVPVSENWLYMTKSRPVEKDPLRAGRDCSANVPDWFKVKESKLVKDHDITKSQGFDGTVTVLSRITGWITVSPRSKNRQNRIGRYGPFDKSKKGVNFQNVSDLAPAWMQNKADRCENTIFKKTLAPNFIREEKSKKRMFLVDKVQPEKSVFSIGDFRHNVSTRDEADHFTKGLSESTKRIFEWKEEISKQPYDKPITGKVGQ